ncbi:MAG: protease HtpX [Chromatiales bacterium]|jgi:heat shock protein HtpX
MTRILLFLGTNLSVIVLLSITLNVIGAEVFLKENGIDLDLQFLLIFAAIFGMGGSFISLAMSKWMAKRAMRVQVIEQPRSQTEQWLVETVRRQAREAGIGMPEVGIFDSPQPNAFATGMSKNSSLVAVSTGLMHAMTQDEVEAVLGHEVAHVANGDMVTLALIQGVINTFVIALSRVIGHIVDRVILKNERGYGLGYFATVLVTEIFLALIASTIVMWFSRRREFHADAGGARLAGRQKMIDALRRLKAASEPKDLPGQLAAFGISGGIGDGFKRLFMSHPPLEQRIAALEAGR